MDVKTLDSVILPAHYLLMRGSGKHHLKISEVLEHTLDLIFFALRPYYFEKQLLATKVGDDKQFYFSIQLLKIFLTMRVNSLSHISWAVPYHSPLRKPNNHFNSLPKLLLSQIHSSLCGFSIFQVTKGSTPIIIPSIHNISLPFSSLQ